MMTRLGPSLTAASMYSGHFCGMAEMLTPVRIVVYLQHRWTLTIISGRLHSEQYCMGIGQVEGCLQGPVDLRARHSQCQSPSHPPEVRLSTVVVATVTLIVW